MCFAAGFGVGVADVMEGGSACAAPESFLLTHPYAAINSVSQLARHKLLQDVLAGRKDSMWIQETSSLHARLFARKLPVVSEAASCRHP